MSEDAGYASMTYKVGRSPRAARARQAKYKVRRGLSCSGISYGALSILKHQRLDVSKRRADCNSVLWVAFTPRGKIVLSVSGWLLLIWYSIAKPLCALQSYSWIVSVSSLRIWAAVPELHYGNRSHMKYGDKFCLKEYGRQRTVYMSSTANQIMRTFREQTDSMVHLIFLMYDRSEGINRRCEWLIKRFTIRCVEEGS